MAVMTFAAIDIGSYEVSMKIFEMSKRIGFRELNDVRYSLEIGKGVYSDGKIDSEMLNVLCEVLNDFKRLMQDFGVEEYRACGTSAFRELVNPLLIIEQIYQRTGMKIEILSSAEQHFLGYKSIAAIEKGFKKMIQKGTAILDVGGGSLQVSLFDKDALVTTQGLKMGSLRIRQRLQELEKTTIHYDKLVEEFIRNDLMSFQRLYLKDKDIKNVILMGDFITDMIFQEEMEDKIITREEFMKRYEDTVGKSVEDFSEEQMAVIRKLAEQERMLEPVLNPDFSPEQMQLVSDISEKIWNDNGRWQEDMIEPYTDHVMNPEEITRVRQELDLQESESESEDVVVQEQWDENVFEYQGYHFEAVGILPQGLEGKELVNQTRGNTELHLTTYEREDDILYSYAGFYEASGSSKADIFRCMETGRNYIPGENELFGYEGEFLPYLQNEQVQEQEPHNFHITDDDLGAGGPKAKFKANMEAIRLLKELEQDQRLATSEEQEVLSRYVGWGGIPQAFEERKDKNNRTDRGICTDRIDCGTNKPSFEQ